MINLTNIDLPYIEKNRTRHGQLRYYFRVRGKRICRLPDDIDSEEFSRAYWKARKTTATPLDEPGRALPVHLSVVPRSFQWLSLMYIRSHDFLELDVTTQSKRRAIIEAMWEEPIALNKPQGRLFRDMPMVNLDRANIEVLRDRKRDTPFAADERLKILRQIMDTQDANGRSLVDNHARLVKPFRRKTDGHHTITSDEIGQYIDKHGAHSNAVYALSLLMYTGLRVSDLAALGPQHRRGDMFRLRLFKNRNRTPVDIEIAIHPILEAVIASRSVRGLTYLQTEYGNPFTVKGLGKRISDWFNQADLPHCSAHSVRKGLATDQAHNEATDNMLEAMFGWRDGKTSKIYTQSAERARLARHAVAKINWDGMGTKLLPWDGAESSKSAASSSNTD